MQAIGLEAVAGKTLWRSVQSPLGLDNEPLNQQSF